MAQEVRPDISFCSALKPLDTQPAIPHTYQLSWTKLLYVCIRLLKTEGKKALDTIVLENPYFLSLYIRNVCFFKLLRIWYIYFCESVCKCVLCGRKASDGCGQTIR